MKSNRDVPSDVEKNTFSVGALRIFLRASSPVSGAKGRFKNCNAPQTATIIFKILHLQKKNHDRNNQREVEGGIHWSPRQKERVKTQRTSLTVYGQKLQRPCERRENTITFLIIMVGKWFKITRASVSYMAAAAVIASARFRCEIPK